MSDEYTIALYARLSIEDEALLKSETIIESEALLKSETRLNIEDSINMRNYNGNSQNIDKNLFSQKHISNSIQNQLDLLQRYASQMEDYQGARVLEFYDDGYTGTNFNRPMFLKMMQLVKKKEINCIIVKDFSRLGRNYIDACDYMEREFPSFGVRFISVNDHYDSFSMKNTGNIEVFLKNLMNDYYSKDLSKKVKSAVQTKKKQGLYIGSFCIYGYQKRKDDLHRIEIDEEAAIIVRKIFQLAQNGMSCSNIAIILNDKSILPPLAYRLSKTNSDINRKPDRDDSHKKTENNDDIYNNYNKNDGSFKNNDDIKNMINNYHTTIDVNDKYDYNRKNIWSRHTVIKILRDERYTGKYITKLCSYKTSSTILPKKNEHIIITNHHPAIVTNEIFQNVQANLQKKILKSYNEDKNNILSRKIKCGYCRYGMIKVYQKKHVIYHCSSKKYDKKCKYRNDISEEMLLLTINKVISNNKLIVNNKVHTDKESQKNQESPKNKVDIQYSKPSMNMNKNLEYGNAQKSKSSIQKEKSISDEIRKIKERKIELYLKYKDEKIGLKDYKSKKEIYDNQLNELQKTLLTSYQNTLQAANNIPVIVEDNRDMNDNKDYFMLTKPMIQMIIKTIYIYEQNRIEIILNFADVCS